MDTFVKRRLKAERAEHEEQLQQGSDEIDILGVSAYRPRRISSPTWRECIMKIWEVDPLECPKCHGGDEDHQFHHREAGHQKDP